MGIAQSIMTGIREVYGVAEGDIPLHAPIFHGNEAQYVQSTIESTFVSSVGAYVDQFERQLTEITGARHAVAMVNGTTALQMALILAGVQRADLVITQSLSFVGTANAIKHAGADVVFVDVDRQTLGLSPEALTTFLDETCELTENGPIHKASQKRVAACVPMHSFGMPARIDELQAECDRWRLTLVEDAAEALGSRYNDRSCGTFGKMAALSFNGNKICTTGGGGALLTNDGEIARRAKHLTTTAKLPHRWLFQHDEIGFNFRMPNINAALGCAQLERLDEFLAFKRDLAQRYADHFAQRDVTFLIEPEKSEANYWLCAIMVADREQRDEVLAVTNDGGVMTRPIWEPLHTLPPYRDSLCGDLAVTMDIAERLINIPSGFRETA